MNTIFLRMAVPTELNESLSLAPRVQGKGQYNGEAGWAVQINNEGLVHVYWDDAVKGASPDDWCSPEELLFV